MLVLSILLVTVIVFVALYKYMGYWFMLSLVNPKSVMVYIHKNYMFFNGDMFPPVDGKSADFKEVKDLLNSHKTPIFSIRKTRLYDNKVVIKKMAKHTFENKIDNYYLSNLTISGKEYVVRFCQIRMDEYLGLRKKITLYTNLK